MQVIARFDSQAAATDDCRLRYVSYREVQQVPGSQIDTAWSMIAEGRQS
jgi:hypothetical protein